MDTNKKMILLAFFLIFFVLIAQAIITADATPLFSVQSARKCNTCHVEPDPSDPIWDEKNYKIHERKCRLSCGVCHVNPSGGMLRNNTGFYYGTKTLPLKTEIAFNLKESIQKIRSNEFLSMGLDSRFLFLVKEDRERNPVFFPMQADFYVSTNLHEHISFFSQIGMERGGNASVREAGGIIGNLPFNSYLKLGKFIPPYGHRLEDHTAFIRNKIMFDQSDPNTYVSGYEIGMEPVLLYARFSQFNADRTPSSIDERTRRGYSAVAGWRGLWLHLGASFINTPNYETTSTETINRMAYGIYGALRFKNLSYLFEWDRREDEFVVSSLDTEADITFSELNYLMTKGLNLKMRYETFTPDNSSSEGDEERYVIGVDFFPYPFTEINLQYRNNIENNIYDVLLIAHLWF